MSDKTLNTLKEAWGWLGGGREPEEQKTDISYIVRNYPKNPGDMTGADRAIIKFINKVKRIPVINVEDVNSIAEIMASVIGEDLDFCKHEVERALAYYHKYRGIAGLNPNV